MQTEKEYLEIKISKLRSLKSRNEMDTEEVVTVGPGVADFATLNGAIDYLSKKYPQYNGTEEVRAVIEIQDGMDWAKDDQKYRTSSLMINGMIDECERRLEEINQSREWDINQKGGKQ